MLPGLQAWAPGNPRSQAAAQMEQQVTETSSSVSRAGKWSQATVFYVV